MIITVIGVGLVCKGCNFRLWILSLINSIFWVIVVYSLYYECAFSVNMNFSEGLVCLSIVCGVVGRCT